MAQNNNKLSGKLELNWVNKNKTLIVKDYEKGSYEWANALNLDLGEEARKNEKWRFLYITKGDMSKSYENWNMLKEICRV